MRVSDQIDPVIGFRSVDIQIPGFIVSGHNKSIWLPGAVPGGREESRAATCTTENHIPPNKECMCGFNAYKKFDDAEGYFIISCFLWGGVHVYQKGYRAQFAYPRSAFLFEDMTLDKYELVKEVAKRYNILVEPMQKRLMKSNPLQVFTVHALTNTFINEAQKYL